MNIIEIVRPHFQKRPNAVAIQDMYERGTRQLTFADLDKRSAQVAGIFKKQGLQAGDAVLLFYPMSIELYITLVAVFRLGLIAMFLDPSAGKDHIERCCVLNPPKALIASPRAQLLRLLSPAIRKIPRKFVIGKRLPGAISLTTQTNANPYCEYHSCSHDTPALITFTSGSTGEPKATVRTHGFLVAQYEVLQHNLDMQSGAIDMTTLPIFTLCNLGAGMMSIIPNGDLRRPGAIEPGPVIAQLKKHHAQRIVASPAFFEQILGHCEKHGIVLPELTYIFSGGGPVFPRLMSRLQKIAPNARINAVYGSTEAEPIAEVNWNEIHSSDLESIRSGNGLLVGTPVPEVQVRIIRHQWGKPMGSFSAAEFENICLTNGEAGEIVVTGPHVLSGYLHGRGDEETKFRVDGTVWHRTGDAGYFDQSGRLWLLGRVAARIRDERGILYPFAVESVLSFDESIGRTALAQYRGRRVLIIERSSKRYMTTELTELLNWAHIDAILYMNQIPVDKRHNAKVDYGLLSKALEQGNFEQLTISV
ncbi:AMP-binding protein [Brevibacterium sp. JNUCC-42]|nr:AMP-binding protein [Brevibacterium sp. JNUCC-42]